MTDIVIIGAGNFGREVAQLIEDINMDKKSWNLLGFIDETKEKHGTIINNNLVIGGFDWFEKKLSKNVLAVYAIGNPKDKYKLIKRTSSYNIAFGNLIHPDTRVSKFVEFGVGNIICCNTLISANSMIGNHVSINPGCGIGHDATIEDYSTLYWNITLSGNVKVSQGCEIGSKAVIIPQKTIGDWSIIGAGSVVVKDIPANCTAVGVPAKPIKFH